MSYQLEARPFIGILWRVIEGRGESGWFLINYSRDRLAGSQSSSLFFPLLVCIIPMVGICCKAAGKIFLLVDSNWSFLTDSQETNILLTFDEEKNESFIPLKLLILSSEYKSGYLLI
jgi:hypothetical protein